MMLNAAYFIIVVIIGVWAVLTGFRKGLVRQIGAVLGVAFGIVAARTLSPEFIGIVNGWLPKSLNGFNRSFVCLTLTSGLIFLVAYGIVSVCSLPLNKMMKMIPVGILGSIGGSLFRLFQYLLFLSLFYNLLADLNPSSSLTRASSMHDGNILEGVMKIAPPILDFPGAEDVAFRQQMEDAKKIS